jgi:hypothetical protein
MAISTTNIRINFDLVNGTLQLIDVHDYVASEGWGSNGDVEGRIVITGPDGEIFYKTLESEPADIDRGVGSEGPFINIPKLGDGSYEQGLYSFEYTAYTDNPSTDTVGITKAFEFCYKSPEVTLEMNADCLLPLLSSEDKTDYVVGGITPTIVRDHKLHYPVGSGTDTYNGGELKYLPTQIFYTKTHSAELTTSLTYEYPNEFFIIDRVKGAEEINVKCDNTICDMYCCLIGMYYRFRDAQKTNRTLAKELETKWIRAEALRNRVYDAYQCNKSEDVSGLVEEILKLGDCQPGCGCSEDGDAPTLITSITSDPFTPIINDLVQQIGGASGGSGEVNGGENLGAGKTVFAGKPAEDLQFKTFIAGGGIQLDETATEITITATPSSGGGTSGTTVVMAGTGIYVTDTGSGTTTTYEVEVSQDLIDKINSLYNTDLTAGDGISLNETVDSNGNKTIEVSSTTANLDYYEATYSIEFYPQGASSSVPVIKPINTRLVGTKFQTPSLKFIDGSFGDIDLYGSWTGQALRINIYGFNSTGSLNDFIPTTSVVDVTKTVSTPVPGSFLLSLEEKSSDDILHPQVNLSRSRDAIPGSFTVKLFNSQGNVLTPSNITGLGDRVKLYFSIKIS